MFKVKINLIFQRLQVDDRCESYMLENLNEKFMLDEYQTL